MRPTQLLTRLSVLALLGVNFAPLTFAADNVPKREGDPSIAAPILAKTRDLKPDGQAHLLTKANLSGVPGTYGTEVHLSTVQGAPARLVVSSWTPQGVFSQEYYVDNDQLVFVYETLSLFADQPPTGWRNFMGYSGWERRIYLTDESIGFIETFGQGAPPADATKLIATVAKLVDAVCRESTTPDFKCR